MLILAAAACSEPESPPTGIVTEKFTNLVAQSPLFTSNGKTIPRPPLIEHVVILRTPDGKHRRMIVTADAYTGHELGDSWNPR